MMFEPEGEFRKPTAESAEPFTQPPPMNVSQHRASVSHCDTVDLDQQTQLECRAVFSLTWGLS